MIVTLLGRHPQYPYRAPINHYFSLSQLHAVSSCRLLVWHLTMPHTAGFQLSTTSLLVQLSSTAFLVQASVMPLLSHVSCLKNCTKRSKLPCSVVSPRCSPAPSWTTVSFPLCVEPGETFFLGGCFEQGVPSVGYQPRLIPFIWIWVFHVGLTARGLSFVRGLSNFPSPWIFPARLPSLANHTVFISFCSICLSLTQTWMRAVNSHHAIAWILSCLEFPSAKQMSPSLLNLATLKFSGHWQSVILYQDITVTLSSLILDRVLPHLWSPLPTLHPIPPTPPSCPHLLTFFWTPTRRTIKHCPQHWRAFLVHISKLFHIPPQRLLQMPKNYMVKFAL